MARTLTEPAKHPSVIVVRQRIHIKIAGQTLINQDQDHLYLCVNQAELDETFLSPLVLVKTHLAFATSLSFHDVCSLNKN